MYEANPTCERSEDGFLVPKGIKKGYNLKPDLVFLDEERKFASD